MRSRLWAGNPGVLCKSQHKLIMHTFPWPMGTPTCSVAEGRVIAHRGVRAGSTTWSPTEFSLWLTDSEAVHSVSPISLMKDPFISSKKKINVRSKVFTSKVSGLTHLCHLFYILGNSCGVNPCRINTSSLHHTQPLDFQIGLVKHYLCCLVDSQMLTNFFHWQPIQKLYIVAPEWVTDFNSCQSVLICKPPSLLKLIWQ